MLNRLISLALAGALSLGLVTAAPAAQGSGCMPTTGTVSGLSFAQFVNAAFAALISGNSGASAPATDCTAVPIKGQTWVDTSVTPNLEKRYDGTSWVTVGAIDSANHLWAPPVGGGTASVTAATTTDICAAPSAVQTITGTTAITSLGSACVVGARKTLIFNSATSLTYNATSLIIPGQRSYTTSAGDMADAIYLGSGNWRIKEISKIDGSSVTNPAIPLGTIIYGSFGTIPPKTVYGAGQALSRASYPDFVAATTRTQNATMGSGNNSLSGLSSTAGFGAGMPVEGTGISAGTVITAVTSGTSMTISPVATTNGTNAVTVFLNGYGLGGDSTTIGTFDCRGNVIAGRDNQFYGFASGRLSATYFGADPNRLGAYGGSQSQTLTVAQLPSHTHAGSGTTASQNQTHSHGLRLQIQSNGFALSGGATSVVQFVNLDQVGGAGTTGDDNTPHTHGFSFTTDGGTGGGAAHPNVQPTAIAECVQVVLP
jgi:microcystin-dependent protein